MLPLSNLPLRWGAGVWVFASGMAVLGSAWLLGVNALLSIPVVGWVIGGGLVLLGISGLFGKSKTDKVTGGLMMAAGGAGAANAPFSRMRPHARYFW